MMQNPVAYHIEGDDIPERDIASFVAVDEMLVYKHWATSCRQAQDKGSL